MRNIILLGLLAFASAALAQTSPVVPGNSSICGSVADSTSSQAIEFATITLFRQPDNQPANGALADEKGKFSIDHVAAGTYSLEVTFLGYAKKRCATSRWGPIKTLS